MKTIRAADLFCGAGGTSTGLYRAAERLGFSVNLLAVNHWKIAIATHSANHREALHLCETLDGVDPRKVVPGGRLDLLVASPECTHHSNARGGRPMSDQSRASAWHVVRWAEALRIEAIIVENVREFTSWGPLGANGRPLKSRRGETFQAWLQALRSLNYAVDHKVLNAADFGDPTTRQRLFILAIRGRGPVVWPTKTHSKDGGRDLTGATEKWRAAREIIEWEKTGKSIFNRKTPLSPNTLRRIAAGFRKFNGIDLEPCLIKLYGTSDGASIEKPVPTVTGGGQHLGLAQPFMLGQQSGATPRSTDKPAPTVAAKGAIGLAQPFLIPFFGERRGQEPRTHSVDDPAPAVTSHGAGGIVAPFLTEYHGDGEGKKRVRSVKDPLPTLDCPNRFGLCEGFMVSAGGPEVGPRSTEDPAHTVLTREHIALVRPFMAEYHGGDDSAKRTRSVDEPIPTATCSRNQVGLIQPFLVDANHGIKRPAESQERRAQSIDDPLGVVTSSRGKGICRAFLVQYNGTADAQSVDRPVGTVTGKPRYALCVAVGDQQYLLDIRFRMLTPRELARAQGFPDSYKFAGNTEAVVRQIGNAVPVGLAEALCTAALRDKRSAAREG